MEHDRLCGELEALETLGQVLRWTLDRNPRPEFVNVVVQDEYTHDVVVRVADHTFAVFDTS